MLVEEERGLQVLRDQDLEDFTTAFCNGKVKRNKEQKVRKEVRDQGIRDGVKVQIAPPLEHKGSAVVLALPGRGS